jgi:dolichol-phosphate mannosyltransferase
VIVIPTFNERENIGILIESIEKVFSTDKIYGSILVVDDNSPDGTSEVAYRLSESYSNIKILKRKEKLGLGSAYREGFRFALETMKADIVFEMDADLSHDPKFIPDFIRELEDGCDMVVGSRHIPGSEIQGWSIYRHLVSSTGNAIAKITLGIGVSDVTTGFRAYKAEALKKIDFETITSEGYGFQIETLFRSDRVGLRVGEAPIVFTDRRAGASKLGSQQILQFIRTVSRLFLVRLSRIVESIQHR